jgi:hypothetical protein
MVWRASHTNFPSNARRAPRSGSVTGASGVARLDLGMQVICHLVKKFNIKTQICSL